jgi:hypothetical protein
VSDSEPDLDERFSLHPDDPEDVLRKLLRQRPTDERTDEADDKAEVKQP